MIASLRKFGNFVVGLFPLLGTLAALLLSPWRQLVKSSPALSRKIEACESKLRALARVRVIKAATPAFQRFYWKDYSRDRLDANNLPPGSLTVLRPLFLVTVTLCLFMPLLCLRQAAPVLLTTLAGVTSSAPAWSIYLWILAAALSWGFLLAGAAVCNRLIFCFVAVIYISLFGACGFFLPRSYGNLFVPAAVFFACALSASSLTWPNSYAGTRAWQEELVARMAALVVGVPAGIYLIALTPMQLLFKPFVWQCGAIIGGLLALSITNLCSKARPPGNTRGGGRFISQLRLSGLWRKPLSLGTAATILSSLTLAFLLNLLERGGLGALAGQFVSEMSLWNGYLWPVWYFVGIGIVFKLLKNTKVVTRAIKEAMPVALYHLVVVSLVLFGALLTWRSTLIELALGAHVLEGPAVWLYQNTVWFWSQPINSFSAPVLKWIFLFDLAAICWLLVKRKWNSERAGTILYFSALSWFAVSEYMFQWLSFGRSPAHSVILLTTFSMWLIWLLHTIGLDISLQSSRAFPAQGRLAIYGSVVVFALLEIHARCAISDFRVMNEIFLFMFRGIIDVGLPYFLYVFACRRFNHLPLQVGQIFKIFCLGALLTYPLNVLDKLALGGWSVAGLLAIWNEEIASFSSNGYICAQEPNLAFLSLALRAACFVLVLVTIASRVAARGNCRGAVIFAALAFASGFASFSKTIVDLPLPDNLRVLVAPFHTSLFFDYHLIALYLSSGISALSLALVATAKNSPGKPSALRWTCAALAALAIDLSITWAWPGQEVWLRSSGLVNTGTAMGGLVLVYLLGLCVRLIESESEFGNKSDNKSENKSVKEIAALSLGEFNIIMAIIFATLLFIACRQIGEAQLNRQIVSPFLPPLQVPARFGRPQVDQAGKSACYFYKDKTGLSTLSISQVESGGRSLKAIMIDLVSKTIKAHSLQDFSVIGMEDWRRWADEAVVLRFNYSLPAANGAKTAMNGITLLAPGSGPLASYYCLTATAADMERRRYDLVRVVRHW